jgi:hypothetical protein
VPAQCIRFGHTVPVDAHVDAEIVQDEDASISHTWTNYKFGDFSNVIRILSIAVHWPCQQLAPHNLVPPMMSGGGVWS